MKQQFTLILLYALIINIFSYQCVFDKLYNNPSVRKQRLLIVQDNKLINGLQQQKNQRNQQKHRQRYLQTTVRQNIRITLDTTNLSTITLATNAPNTTFVNLNYIKRAMQVAERFFQLRLKVTPVARIISPATCMEFIPLSNDRTFGISNSDLHIYVRYITINSTLFGYGATGVSCKLNSNSGTPDLTYSHGRPIVGRIEFNTFNIIDSKTMTNLLFSSITATSIHQMIHILGFDSTLYSTYLDSTGNYYSATLQQLTPIPVQRPTTYVLTTPRVANWTHHFFDCFTIHGMLLENQQGFIGSHWQRTAMYDQIMTGTSLGAQKGISALTYALLKDMGWYQVDDTLNDTSNYGYKKGCSFLNDACYSTTDTFSEFCSYSSDTSRCATNFLGKAVCSTNPGLWADGCGIYGSYMNCVDQTTSDEGYTAKTSQKYGINSFCVYSNFGIVSIPTILRSRCYPYTCLQDTKTIKFTIGTSTVTCSNSQAGNSKILSSMIGTLTCPDYNQFCQQSRKLCTNWCSKNGFCTGGICHCLPGYYGKDCSITTCVSGQFYEQSIRKCVSSCPTKTYTSLFSFTCLPCDSICQQCRDQPHICTTCLSTVNNRQYQYNSQCYSQCPSKTFNAGDYCYDCDSSIFCFDCSIIKTNCTSCDSGKYLENPISGACVDTCTSPYIRRDVVNFKCVQSCTENLVEVADTCDLCPLNSYKYVANSTCIANCPDRYFQDATQRLCVQCDSSCLECDGSYAQNCTRCSTSGAQKYLLLKMCSISCPNGYYTDQTAGKCQQCPDQSCVTCAFNTSSNSVYCKSCIYGFYLQPNKTCDSTCPTYYFINSWNLTCDPCNAQCGDCYSNGTNACINCRLGKNYLVNFTGGFCLSSCPTEKYVRSGSNCLQCHETCKTCTGTNSNDCSSCISQLYRYSGMCRYVCPSGTFANNESRQCHNCSQLCKHCFGNGEDECTICNSGLYLNNHTCTDRCPDDKRQNAWNVCFQIRMVSLALSFALLFLVFD